MGNAPNRASGVETIKLTFADVPPMLLSKWQESADLLAEIMEAPAALIMKAEAEHMEVAVSAKSQGNPYHPGDKEIWHGLYCETVIKTQEKLVVSNALKDPKWRNNPDIKLGMIAYIGFPLCFPDGSPYGTICVLDRKERHFTDREIKQMRHFRDSVQSDLRLLALHIGDERKNRLLRESEERYRAFIAQVTDGVYRFELTMPMPLDLPVEEQIDFIYDHSCLAECNPAFLQMYQIDDPADIIGKSLLELHGSRDNPVNRESQRQFLLSGCKTENQLTEEIGAAGHRKFFNNNVLGIIENGHVVRLWGTQTDITERKRAEEDNRKIQQQLQMVVENFPDGIVVLYDSQFRYHFAEGRGLANIGLSKDDLLGKTVRETFPPDFSDTLEEKIVRAFEGAQEEFEIALGHKVFTETTIPVMYKRGQVEFVLGVITDITERKKLEADARQFDTRMHQTQRLESLGVLAGGIAHDFNNILAAIMGNAELALDDISPLSPGRESLAEIVTASKRAAELCSQMLAYAGKRQIEKRNIALGDLVEETLHMLKTCISKKAMLNLNLEKSLPCMSGDPAQIRQILMNLVINASEAIGERSGVIALSTGAMDCSEQYLAKGYIVASNKPGTYVYIEVSDTGCGMDKETIQRIFEPFFTTKFTGRGLGLAAILGIVKAHEGALRVYSEPGKGSTFKVLFPAIEGTEDREPENDANRDWHGSGTVLLADDEESIRAMCSKQLQRLGLEVLTAEDGRQAVNRYRERKDAIALVLLDLTMPHMNGEEAFRELRQINPNVRVILASGYSESDIAARFAGKGLAGFLQKPYTMDKLRSLLSTLLPKAKPTTRSEEGKCPNNGMQTR